jgi:hypothetical protein
MHLAPIAGRSIDQLEEAMISLATRMNATEYEFLVLVREFDIRQGWRSWNLNNTAEWLNMKCGISLGAAREKVRVALALLDLRACSEAFAAGDLSYSKARAMTRVATPRNEEELLALAIPRTVSQVEAHCRAKRNAQRRESTADANRAHAARCLYRHQHPDGAVSITIELPQETGELLMKAIEMAASVLQPVKADHVAHGGHGDAEGSFFARQADALVEIARSYLKGGVGGGSTADHYQVMVHVDQTALFHHR